MLLYIGTATELPQLAKVPMLVLHYIEHAQYEQFSLDAFIAEHYFRGDVYDADRNRDMQLPFKVELPGAWFIIATPPPPALDAIGCDFAIPLVRAASPAAATRRGIPVSIWHPPATCTA